MYLKLHRNFKKNKHQYNKQNTMPVHVYRRVHRDESRDPGPTNLTLFIEFLTSAWPHAMYWR